MQAWLHTGSQINIPVFSLKNEKSQDFEYRFDILSEVLLTVWYYILFQNVQRKRVAQEAAVQFCGNPVLINLNDNSGLDSLRQIR